MRSTAVRPASTPWSASPSAEAQGLCTPLAASSARRRDDALPQIETLLMLGADQGGLEGVRANAHAALVRWPL
jgi:hypothetical protein